MRIKRFLFNMIPRFEVTKYYYIFRWFGYELVFKK